MRGHCALLTHEGLQGGALPAMVGSIQSDAGLEPGPFQAFPVDRNAARRAMVARDERLRTAPDALHGSLAPGLRG